MYVCDLHQIYLIKYIYTYYIVFNYYILFDNNKHDKDKLELYKKAISLLINALPIENITFHRYRDV